MNVPLTVLVTMVVTVTLDIVRPRAGPVQVAPDRLMRLRDNLNQGLN